MGCILQLSPPLIALEIFAKTCCRKPVVYDHYLLKYGMCQVVMGTTPWVLIHFLSRYLDLICSVDKTMMTSTLHCLIQLLITQNTVRKFSHKNESKSTISVTASWYFLVTISMTLKLMQLSWVQHRGRGRNNKKNCICVALKCSPSPRAVPGKEPIRRTDIRTKGYPISSFCNSMPPGGGGARRGTNIKFSWQPVLPIATKYIMYMGRACNYYCPSIDT